MTYPPFKGFFARFRLPYLKPPSRAPPKPRGDVSQADNGSARPPPPRLSVELIERVCDFLFELQPPNLDAANDKGFLSTKPPWEEVSGFMSASVELHKMGYMRWIRSITIKIPADWDIVVPDADLIRELRILDQALSSTRKRVLSHFVHLTTVTIDSHSDITRNAGNQFAYRNLVIATVKEHCPGLEHLRLGRCTIFNRTDPCEFWSAYPFDHDSYISSEGTEEYAHSLAQELVPLKNLKSLRMGLYFAPSSIVLAHKLYHRRGLPAPEVIEWQQAIPLAELTNAEPEQVPPATTTQLISLLHQPDPETEFGSGHNCAMCTESTSQITENAERSANAIISNLVPSLGRIEWMGWLTPKHLGVHVYALKPE